MTNAKIELISPSVRLQRHPPIHNDPRQFQPEQRGHAVVLKLEIVDSDARQLGHDLIAFKKGEGESVRQA